MAILLRWCVRMLRENPLHTVFTVMNMVFNYAMLTGVKLVVRNRVCLDNTDGDGLLLYVSVVFASVIVLSSLLTMYNAFLVSIHERRHRYRMFSSAGATKRQIRGSLFVEALIINVIGAVLGIALGTAVFLLVMRVRNSPGDAASVQDAVRLLLDFVPKNSPEYAGSAFVPTPQRGLYFLLPEMFCVPTAMAMAAGKNLTVLSSGKSRRSKRVRRVYSRATQAVFDAGGVVNRRMDKRDRAHSRVFLTAFLVSVVSVALMAHMLLVSGAIARQDDFLTLRTSGSNPEMEDHLDRFLSGGALLSDAQAYSYYQCYTPRVYCTLQEDQLHRTVLEKLKKADARRQLYLYPVQAGQGLHYLAMPHFLFVRNAEFDRLLSRSGADERTDALLLPGRFDTGEAFAWTDTSWPAVWNLQFYSSENLLMILDARTKSAAQHQKDKPSTVSKVQADYSSKNAQEFLNAAGRSAGSKSVRVHSIAPPESGDDAFWTMINTDTALNHGVPILVFPERTVTDFAPFLADTNNGLHLMATPKPGDENGQVLQDALYRELHSSDGCVAEHFFGTGTRYKRLNPDAAEDETADEALVNPFRDISSRTERFMQQFIYTAPEKIYADLYPIQDAQKPSLLSKWLAAPFSDIFRIACLIALALMLFTMFTNCTNIVFGHHMLRRREYAILQSCGMDERQMRGAVLYEAVWYSVRCMLHALALYLLFEPFILLALSYGMDYERLYSENLLVVSQWVQNPAVNVRNAILNTLYGAVKLLALFPLAGLTVFILFIVINFIVRYRLREDALIILLKKDL